jgi:hypothetical protein
MVPHLGYWLALAVVIAPLLDELARIHRELDRYEI